MRAASHAILCVGTYLGMSTLAAARRRTRRPHRRGGVGLDSRRDSGAALERERSRRRANGNGHLPGLTAEELAERGGLELGVLRTVLNDEQARRRVRLDPVTGRYRLARAAFDPATLAALAELELA
jgi:hypothetical protein